MANAGPNTNESQFFLYFISCDWLDGKHVVFGRTTEEGFDFINTIESVGIKWEKPKKTVEIVDCDHLYAHNSL